MFCHSMKEVTHLQLDSIIISLPTTYLLGFCYNSTLFKIQFYFSCYNRDPPIERLRKQKSLFFII